MTETEPIHTLNARGNVMLEVMRDYFKLKPHHMQREILGMRKMLVESLSKKGVDYAKLKSALVPDRKRREIALVFDTLSIESSWYGLEVFQHVIPLLEKKSNHSILVGDYLDRPGQADQIFSAFEEAVRLRRSIEFRHPTQFYIVYLNNLTDAMIHHFDEGLAAYEAYVGYADTTHASMFKYYLSTESTCARPQRGIKQGFAPLSKAASDLGNRERSLPTVTLISTLASNAGVANQARPKKLRSASYVAAETA